MATKLSLVDALTPALLTDLKRSGLNTDDARSMRLEYKDSEWADENLGDPRGGYLIPYFDMENGRINEMYRFRFLEFAESRTFGGKKVEIKQAKYSQPAGTRPYAYFSRRVNWKDALSDKKRRVLFTEGEKKAEAACKAGMLCIGLGGVYSFRSASREWFFLPELNAIDWTGRDVEICYDSDVMTKKEVSSALAALTEQLVARGAIVHFIFLPRESEDDKVGIDDFLVRHGAKAFHELERQQSKTSEAYNLLNEKAGYLNLYGRYWSFEFGIPMDEGHARGMLQPLAMVIQKGRGKNAVDTEVPAFDSWSKHRHRRTMRGIVYEPGNPRLITEANDVNTWKPSGLRPKRGPVGPWLELVEYVFRKPEYVKWFLQWLAYPLQVPGTKHYTAVFVHGEMQGSGKSFVMTPLARFIYGENFISLDNEALNSQFNADQAGKQLIMLDEVYVPGHANNRIGVMSRLKDMVTREKNNVNQKNEKIYTVFDYANYYLTSNHADALPLDSDDRRFFVIRAPDETRDRAYYANLDAQLRDAKDPRNKPGPLSQYVLHYLLNKVDLSDFDPKANALRTEYREEVIHGAFGTLEEFAYRLATNPDDLIPRYGDITRELAGAETLLDIYYQKYPRASQTTANALGRCLGRYKELLPRKEVRTKNNSPKYTLYALFERKVWEQRSSKDWAQYHETTLQGRKS